MAAHNNEREFDEKQTRVDAKKVAKKKQSANGVHIDSLVSFFCRVFAPARRQDGELQGFKGSTASVSCGEWGNWGVTNKSAFRENEQRVQPAQKSRIK